MKKTLTMLATCSLMALAAAAGAADAPKTLAKPAEGAPSLAGPNGGKGKVLETMDSGGYTYVKVDIGGKAVWAAAPLFKVKKGQTVTVPPGSPMPGFQSPTLKRSFDLIYFVGGVEVEGAKK